MLLALALVLEFIASLLAFTGAVQAGALYGAVECNMGARLERLHQSERVQESCTKMDASTAVGIISSTDSFVNVDCEPTEAPTGEDSFLAQCSCPHEDDYWSASSRTEDCVWIGVEVRYPSSSMDDDTSGLCLAKTFFRTDTSETLFSDGDPRLFGTFDCWAKNPAGTATITIVAFVVAVVGQLVEGFVAWRYFKEPETGPALMTAGSVFEAAGVVAVSVTLINLPSFGEMGEVWVRDLHSDQKMLYGLAVTSATIAGLGALAEIVSGFLKVSEGGSRSTSGIRPCRMLYDGRIRKHRIYYLGAFGGTAIWLGTALLEVVVATFLVWKGEGEARLGYDSGDWGVFTSSLLGFLVAEVIAFFVMCVARFAWARAKLRMLVEPRDSPNRRSAPEVEANLAW